MLLTVLNLIFCFSDRSICCLSEKAFVVFCEKVYIVLVISIGALDYNVFVVLVRIPMTRGCVVAVLNLQQGRELDLDCS